MAQLKKTKETKTVTKIMATLKKTRVTIMEKGKNNQLNN